MPLTPFQKETLLLLAGNRNPDSHLAGGAVINRADNSPRFSSDLDLFHDVAENVAASALKDEQLLLAQGFAVTWQLRQPFLHRAEIRRGGNLLRLDWCYDSAFRFFPVQPDREFGYCLHPADLATNKALALAGRSEIRDFLDILYLHENYLCLGAVCWAACGKDQGFTPASLLDMARRHMKFRDEDLAGEHLARAASLPEIKQAWIDATLHSEALFACLPPQDVGCLYLDHELRPIVPDPKVPDFQALRRHFGSVRGAWPMITK